MPLIARKSTIQWGHKVASLAAIGDGKHRITFSNGSSAPFRRACRCRWWSKVRPLVSGSKPLYTGTCFIETFLSDVHIRHKANADAIGSGTCMAVAPGKGILAHRKCGRVAEDLCRLEQAGELGRSLRFLRRESQPGCRCRTVPRLGAAAYLPDYEKRDRSPAPTDLCPAGRSPVDEGTRRYAARRRGGRATTKTAQNA